MWWSTSYINSAKYSRRKMDSNLKTRWEDKQKNHTHPHTHIYTSISIWWGDIALTMEDPLLQGMKVPHTCRGSSIDTLPLIIIYESNVWLLSTAGRQRTSDNQRPTAHTPRTINLSAHLICIINSRNKFNSFGLWQLPPKKPHRTGTS